MTREDQHTDCKSLRRVIGKTADWAELARDCVCFANGSGGRLLIGIEDGESEPPAGQRIPAELPQQIRKRVGELTVNVQALPTVQRSGNGGEYVELAIHRADGVASTVDGRYFLRVADTCIPLTGDDVLRLADERPGRPWESIDTGVPLKEVDSQKLRHFIAGIHDSDRAKPSVREKGDRELLAHYELAHGATLTRLGVLLLGTAEARRALGTAPIVQAIKYDDRGRKINKWVWDDCELSPVELVDAIWQAVPDFRESYELPEGLYRRNVPAFDEKVIRELLVNALVHRPYTQRGDIFLNLHPDRLEVVNPGRLPLGVTPHNILHASRRRNDTLARAFHDLGLMEREGSGFDLIYERLLSQGRPVPLLAEGLDSVTVTIRRHILHPGVIQLMHEADQRFQLSQRERIALGVLAQSDGLLARELADKLETDTQSLPTWLGRLLDFELVQSSGRTKGTRYFVAPPLLKSVDLAGLTSLKRIESHRLEELIREDVRRYPGSRIGEIHQRIGVEISRSQLRRSMGRLVESGVLLKSGVRAGSRYRLGENR
ncbi:MAG: putative DNA binding domain-containing protein [Ottowia sp.]|nr:putative DNA binding domain-containing protein [Ottowia sp.]